MFERVRRGKRNEFGNKVWPLRHQPQMKFQITSIEGATRSVHETTESWIESRIGTEGKGNVKQAIINCNRHGCKRWTGPKSVHRERFDNLHHEEPSAFLNDIR